MEKVSKATKKIWQRLNVDENKKSLEHRANKRMSKKRIIPKELFKNRKNNNVIAQYIEYIDNNYDTKKDLEKIMRSFCIKWLMQHNLVNEDFTSEKKNIRKFLKENNNIYIDFLQFKLPEDEDDILGILYQCLQTEGEKNKFGSYYTPRNIVKTMISRMDIKEDTKILDPCCGIGTFLLESKIKNPLNLWGVDIDSIAVMIAKVNLFIKYQEYDFCPNIFLMDFLDKNYNDIINENFDYIITNPPWGADVDYVSNSLFSEIKSGESFSYMLIKSQKMLKKNGALIFLLPEAFLNVKVHSDIRKFIIDRMTLSEIILYPLNFSGVLTKFISIVAYNNENDDYTLKISDLENEFFLDKKKIKADENLVISKLSETDKKVLDKVLTCQYNTLKDSVWALGIVTGDNKEKLKAKGRKGLEPIYTGKEISQYKLLPCKNYIEYKRENFQQVAPDRIYRAPEKLVYKFISKNMTFAYDDKQSLVLNSANILIPNIEGVSIKSSLAFLNSKLFKFIYRKKFGEIKILKGNLMQLPFPIITKEEDSKLEELVNQVLDGDVGVKDKIDAEIYKIFDLDEQEIKCIEGTIYENN